MQNSVWQGPFVDHTQGRHNSSRHPGVEVLFSMLPGRPALGLWEQERAAVPAAPPHVSDGSISMPTPAHLCRLVGNLLWRKMGAPGIGLLGIPLPLLPLQQPLHVCGIRAI